MQTPCSEILELFEFVENKYKIQSIVDVGAAYGRAAFVKQAVLPHASFVGYEIVTERAKEANRLFKEFNIKDSIVICKNATKTNLMDADLYLIYDFSNETDIHHLLEVLTIKIQKGHNFFIATMGDSAPSVIKSYFEDIYAVKCPISKNSWNLFSSHEYV